MKARAAFFLGLLAALLPLHLTAAEEGEQHRIDRFYEQCTEKNGSTAGTVECTEKAYKMWDAELNRVYGLLMKKLPGAKQLELKKSQRDWLTYRDSNVKLIDAVYSGIEGTMYIPMQAYSRLQIVRERTLLLIGYLELVSEATAE